MQLKKKSKCKKKSGKKKKSQKTKLPFPANDIQKQNTVNKVRLELCPGPDPPPQSLPSEWALGVGRWVRLRSQPWREMPPSTATSKCWGVLLHPSPTSAHPIHLHNNPEALNQQSSPHPHAWWCLGTLLGCGSWEGHVPGVWGSRPGRPLHPDRCGTAPQLSVIWPKGLLARPRTVLCRPVAVICFAEKETKASGEGSEAAPVWYVGAVRAPVRVTVTNQQFIHPVD